MIMNIKQRKIKIEPKTQIELQHIHGYKRCCYHQNELSTATFFIRLKLLSVIFVSGVKPSRIPTDAEQATGLERKEYEAMAAGIEVQKSQKFQTLN